MKREQQNDNGKLEIHNISCASLIIISNTAGTTPNGMGSNTNSSYFPPYLESCTHNFPHHLISIILIPLSSSINPLHLQPYHHPRTHHHIIPLNLSIP